METTHAQKIDELIDNIAGSMKETPRRLMSSGAISVDDFKSDEYVLAKILVTAAMEQHAKDYYPLYDQHRKELKNLRHF